MNCSKVRRAILLLLSSASLTTTGESPLYLGHTLAHKMISILLKVEMDPNVTTIHANCYSGIGWNYYDEYSVVQTAKGLYIIW